MSADHVEKPSDKVPKSLATLSTKLDPNVNNSNTLLASMGSAYGAHKSLEKVLDALQSEGKTKVASFRVQVICDGMENLNGRMRQTCQNRMRDPSS
ncbi:hypothetical protein PG999_003975 [Apiospora kogelbergensis]|uniref:Uncharacterized protein n=1 Tax=Apiospora kogelbergensis TaxID=1337665 RepID=A0AAW0R556_9PEZI